MKNAKEQCDAGSGKAPLKIKVAGVEREFDINDPELPDWVEENALALGRLSLRQEDEGGGLRGDARAAADRTGEAAGLAAVLAEAAC